MPYVLPDQRRVSADAAFDLDGIQYPPMWLRKSSAADKAALSITWEDPPPAPTPPAPTKDQLKERAQLKRRERELGGMTISSIPVYTDTETQTKIMAARTLAKEDANYTVSWKTSAGSFATLNAATIIALADAMHAYVKACFAAEAAASAAVDAETITTYQQIEDYAWPSNSV